MSVLDILPMRVAPLVLDCPERSLGKGLLQPGFEAEQKSAFLLPHDRRTSAASRDTAEGEINREIKCKILHDSLLRIINDGIHLDLVRRQVQ